MADELDVARSKAGEVPKLEAAMEKYKRKLDEAATVRQHVRDLEEKNTRFLDQVGGRSHKKWGVWYGVAVRRIVFGSGKL
jgi:hypothetical protein